jgi:hypothetical protein
MSINDLIPTSWLRRSERSNRLPASRDSEYISDLERVFDNFFNDFGTNVNSFLPRLFRRYWL